jgi:hypothetical protein
MSGIAPKQNAFKFKIVLHKQKSMAKKKKIGRKRGPRANWAPSLTNPKTKGKPVRTVLVSCNPRGGRRVVMTY